MRFGNIAVRLLAAEAIRQRALDLIEGVDPKGKPEHWQENAFHSLYGSPSKVLTEQWNALCLSSDPDIKLTVNEMSARGFRGFMMAHFFLWQNPKNAFTFGSRFGVCERLARGHPIWKWITKLAALAKQVIIWSNDLDAVNTAKRILSVDGVDFRTWEQKHERYNMDTKDCSKKFNHAAAKYEIALHAYKSQVVWVSGPHRGGKHDLEIFREGLKKKVKKWKQLHADRGYRSSEPDEKDIFSIPCNTDSKENHEYKSRARLRHETFNRRLKCFNILDDTFKYSRDKHQKCVLAIVGTVQFQMNNGHPLFDIG